MSSLIFIDMVDYSDECSFETRDPLFILLNGSIAIRTCTVNTSYNQQQLYKINSLLIFYSSFIDALI